MREGLCSLKHTHESVDKEIHWRPARDSKGRRNSGMEPSPLTKGPSQGHVDWKHKPIGCKRHYRKRGVGKHSHRLTNGDSWNLGVAAIAEERKPPLRALGRGHPREADGSGVAGSKGHQEAKQTRGQGPLLFAVFFCPPASQEKQCWIASHTVLQAKEVQKPT